MFKKLLSLLLFAVVISFGVNAQGVIYGTVTDAGTGETIPGATVLIEETNRGIATLADGTYRLTGVPAGDYKVTFSFVGYASLTLDVSVGSSEVQLNANLQAAAIGLDELVVTGYGQQTKRELTGSISSISAAEFEDVSLQSTEGLLQGRAAGVNVTTTSGNPGGAFRVNIRGNGSVNSATEPLYIIDGVQISFSQQSTQASNTALNALNPSDIQSIEVLKDGASAAIYGAQAAAGVVIITTKRGIAGKTRVTARAETGVRSLARGVDYINPDQYIRYLAEGMALNDRTNGIDEVVNSDISAYEDNRRDFLLNFFGSPSWTTADRDAFVNARTPISQGGLGLSVQDALTATGVSDQLANTDWQDEIFEDGVTQKYSVSASGGDEQTTFYLSGGFEDTEGTAFNSDFTRLSLRTNIDHTISDRFSTSLQANLSRSSQKGVCQDGNFINCPPSQSMFEAPTSFPYLADGEYNPATRFGLANNPAVQENEVDRENEVIQIISKLRLAYRATDWLTINGTVGVDYRNTQDEQYRSAIASAATGGFVFFANRNVKNVTTNLVANLRQTFDDVHNVSGLIGTEYRRDYSESYLVQGDGLPGPFFDNIGVTATPTTAGGSSTEWRLGSYFANAKYNYDEKYYLDIVTRYDGHSRFGAETRWGFFPSVSGAWRITQEDFLDIDVLNELKLRGGYGTTGNSAIGNFASRGLFSADGSYQGSTGLRPDQLANVNLGWEEARELNIGLDYELLEGRISGSVDAYQKDNAELLFSRPLPSDSGYGSITENIGKIRNTGFEFEVSSINVSNRDFSWTTRLNFAISDNEILELPDGNPIREDGALNSLIEGRPIGQIQAIRWAGVNPADGRPMWYDADGNLTYTPTFEDDAVRHHDGVANTVGGFGNTLSYKGVTLDSFFQFSFGQWAFPQTDYYFTRTPDFLMNLADEVEDRWRQPGDVTHYPRAMNGGGTDFPETANYRVTFGTNAIYNTSYIRLKNVSLSYNLPISVTDQIGLANVRLFASATNLITWTAWPWYDPEVAGSATDIYGNSTAASYPTERQVNAGIEIQF